MMRKDCKAAFAVGQKHRQRWCYYQQRWKQEDGDDDDNDDDNDEDEDDDDDDWRRHLTAWMVQRGREGGYSRRSWKM